MTMEMDAINIEQLAKAKPKTPSLPASGRDEIGQPPRKGSGIIRSHDVPQRQPPGNTGPAVKPDSIPMIYAVGAVIVIGLVVVVAMTQQSAPRDHASQTRQSEPALKPSPSPETPPSAPSAKNTVSEQSPIVPVPAVPRKTTELLNETRKSALENAQPTPPVEHAQREISLDVGGGVKMELVLILPGQFEMGSDDGNPNVRPVHTVKISRSFYMGKYVVTQTQYEKVMGKNPSHFKGENLPVEMVSYIDADEFCKKASKLAGKPIRLPTEAEWEFACRAGTKTKFNTGENEAALEQAGWFKGNSEDRTHPVGLKRPNAWGLYDMHGNVWQWCQDWYGEDYYVKAPAEDPRGPTQGARRVLRGGSWLSSPVYCRSAARGMYDPGGRGIDVGFRVVVVPLRTP
jgi:formylglycine-generating enzyme required for sulfatase activity